MKVTNTGTAVLWLAVENATIVECRGAWQSLYLNKNADDTFSRLVALGMRVEGPFDEPL